MQRTARDMRDVVVQRGDEQVAAEEHRERGEHDRAAGGGDAGLDALQPVHAAEDRPAQGEDRSIKLRVGEQPARVLRQLVLGLFVLFDIALFGWLIGTIVRSAPDVTRAEQAALASLRAVT